jgi:hypothetical protein
VGRCSEGSAKELRVVRETAIEAIYSGLNGKRILRNGHAKRRWQMSYYRLPIASLLPSIHARHNFQVRL